MLPSHIFSKINFCFRINIDENDLIDFYILGIIFYLALEPQKKESKTFLLFKMEENKIIYHQFLSLIIV
jgi:hypothetical protein